MRTHNQCFEQKFSNEIFIFTTEKKSLFIAWACLRNEEDAQSKKMRTHYENLPVQYHWVLPSSQYKKVLFDFYCRSR